MRILVSLGSEESSSGDGMLASLARDHELVVSHLSGRFDALRLALRNLLPERDVVSVLTHVVLGAEESGVSAREVAEPRAIAELRSLRALIEAGSLVLCGIASRPLAVDGIGEMHPVEATVDADLAASLLARRLDADLFLLLGRGPEAGRAVAAERFVAATGRRAEVGSPAEAARLALGDAAARRFRA
ncbi:MAG: hypothetical protein R2725_09790 [Solirubrobacterales bacterium]